MTSERGKSHLCRAGAGRSRIDERQRRRAIHGARHVAYFRKAGRQGQARSHGGGLLPEAVVEHAMEYPVTTEIHFRPRIQPNAGGLL